jgi:hypothetical protein
MSQLCIFIFRTMHAILSYLSFYLSAFFPNCYCCVVTILACEAQYEKMFAACLPLKYDLKDFCEI